MTERPAPLSRDRYAVLFPTATRFGDNDTNLHVNNSAYYGFVDTAIALFALRHDYAAYGGVHVTVENGCRYFSELHFPDALEVGVRVERVGSSSIAYRIGIFRAGEALPAAEAHTTHVLIDAASRRPTPVPDGLRARLATTG